MNLREVAKLLSLWPATAEDQLDREVAGCYAGDLLSVAMASAHQGDVWLTTQSHANIVAVAVLLDLAGVIITGSAQIDAATVERANGEGVVLLTTAAPTYAVAGRLWELGIRPSE